MTNATATKTQISIGAPFSQEAEEAALGSILIDPHQYLKLVTFLKADDFFLLRHNYIWQAMARLYERREPIDPITLAEELENMGHLDKIGGRAYLVQLSLNIGTSVHAEVYGKIVERTALRRKLMIASDEIKKIAQDESMNAATVVEDAQYLIMQLRSSESNSGPIPLFEALSTYYDEMEYRMQQDESTFGIPSGFRDLDNLMGGWQRGDLITIAGRPGMGKSSFKLCMAMNAARLGAHVLFTTLEMPIDQFVTRMLAIETGVNVQKLRLTQLTPQEAARVTEAIGRLSRWPLWLWETPSLTVQQLQTQARRIHYEHRLDVVIVDYLQLMTDNQLKDNNRYQEISKIAREMKQVALDLNVPVVQGAQLSRAVENRANKRPILSDLRESGEIEQSSDVVAFLYRDDVYNDLSEFPNQADVIVSKHRNGPTGVISLYFEKSLTKFMDATVHRVDLNDLI